jgi:transposase
MIPAGVRIFVCTEPVDMRRGFDRLAQTAKEIVGIDPQQGGALFVFANRRASRIKVLWFERNGYCMLYKRLHRAVFDLPMAGAGAASVHIDAPALAKLLAGRAKETQASEPKQARCA